MLLDLLDLPVRLAALLQLLRPCANVPQKRCAAPSMLTQQGSRAAGNRGQPIPAPTHRVPQSLPSAPGGRASAAPLAWLRRRRLCPPPRPAAPAPPALPPRPPSAHRSTGAIRMARRSRPHLAASRSARAARGDGPTLGACWQRRRTALRAAERHGVRRAPRCLRRRTPSARPAHSTRGFKPSPAPGMHMARAWHGRSVAGAAQASARPQGGWHQPEHKAACLGMAEMSQRLRRRLRATPAYVRALSA